MLRSATSCLAARSAILVSSEPTGQLDPRQTKVVLPKKKPEKWSTGVGRGEYGGPPTTTKLRKYWGGGDEDPVTSNDDFIWNKNFVPHMQRLIHQDDVTGTPSPVSLLKEPDSGFLSLTRAMNLQSPDIDLSRELAPPPKPLLEHQVEAARMGRSVAAENLSTAPAVKWRLAPTRREQAKWDRATKAATGGTDVILRESKRVQGDPEVGAAQAREQYIKLKKRLQTLTLGIGGIGVVSAYFSYSPEIAASFGAGLLGSLMYLRMLGNSVDSIAGGSQAIVKSVGAQPRLLVPVVLVMMYNRWNEILVPHYGFFHLDLIPMLVGFFTYKIATFAQAIQDSFVLTDSRSELGD